MIKNLLLVALGSAVGGALRYVVSLMMRWNGNGFPWATFAVNLVGCLVIGLLAGFLSRHSSENLSLLLVTGLCGGFTTFSTFSRESLALIQQGQWCTVVLYVAGSVVLGVLLTFMGYGITKA